MYGSHFSSHFGSHYAKHYPSTEELQNLLLSLNFREPNTQERPAEPISGASATAVWRFDEASGNFVDEVASAALTPAAVSQDVTLVGPYNGTDTYSLKGARMTSTASRAEAGSSAFLDQTTGSFASLLIFRSIDPDGNGAHSLFGKQELTSTAGYNVVLYGSTRTRTFLRDGSGNQVSLNHDGDFNDGAWHYVAFVVDRTAQVIRMYSDVTSVTTSTTISGVGSVTNTYDYRVGRTATYSGALVDVAYNAVWEGAQVEAFTQSDFDSVFRHGTVPDGASALDTYTRASACAPIVGNESGFGVRVCTYGSGQFAHAYHSAFDHTSDLGMLVEPQGTNLLLYSEFDASETGWTNQGSAWDTFDGAGATAPDGTTTAILLDNANGDRGKLRSSAVNFTGGVAHTVSFFGRSDEGTPPGVAIFFDGVEYDEATTGITLTGDWARYSYTFTPSGSNAALELRNTGPTSMEIWGVQLEEGSVATSYIRTSGASASRVVCEPSVSNMNTNGWINNDAGEVSITYVPRAVTGAAQLVALKAAGNNDHKRWVADGNTCRFYDGAGTLRADAGSSHDVADTEATMRGTWEAENFFRMYHGGIQRINVAVAGAEGATDLGLFLGNNGAGGAYFHGVIATVNTYTEEQ